MASSSSTILRRWCKKDDDVKKDNKLKAETVELLNKFLITVSATKTAVTAAKERKVISSAYKEINDIRRDLVNGNGNPAAAAADIRECRSKIERQISDFYCKLSNLTIKDSYRRRHPHQFKTTKRPATSQIYGQLKRKASTKQPPKSTGTRKQNSVRAQQFQQEDTSITEEINYLEKLILEEKDYDETARFIETSLRMHTTKEDRKVLFTAYENFIRVDVKLHDLIRSIEDDETQGKDLNVSHMINNYRSIIAKELSDVCDKVSNLTIKEAYLHHLDEFKTRAKPKKYTQRFINQKESPDIFFKMKGGSRSGGSKSLNSIKKQPHIHEDFDENDFHDHNKCVEEERESQFSRFGLIGNWDPIYVGRGADLLHAPGNHSVKEELQSYYDMVREACKPPDTLPTYRVDYFDLFDDF